MNRLTWKRFLRSKGFYCGSGALIALFSLWIGWDYFQREPLSFAHDLSEDGYQSNLLEIFSNRVELQTQNKIQIGTKSVAHLLWPTSQILEDVVNGTYAFGSIYLEHLGKEDPLFFLDTLPFLVTSYEQSEVLWDVMEPYVKNWLKSRGLVYLFSIPCLPQDLFLDRKITTESSVRGLKIRAHGQMASHYLSFLGMTPVRFLGPIYYEYLKEAHLNGFVSSRSSAYSPQTPIQAPYYYKLNYGISYYIVVMNQKEFDSLSLREQKIIYESAQLSGRLARKMSRNFFLKRMETVKEEVVPAWFQEKSLKTAQFIIESWKSLAGPLGGQFLESYKKRLQELNISLPFVLKKFPVN